MMQERSLLKGYTDSLDSYKHVREIVQDQLIQDNGSRRNLDGVIPTTTNGSIYLHQSKVKQADLPNGVVREKFL